MSMWFTVQIPEFRSGSAKVYVALIDTASHTRWEVQGVNEHPSDRRRKVIAHRVNTDNCTYRRLNADERRAYEINFYRELLGEEVLRDVLRQAWMQAMPEELKDAFRLFGDARIGTSSVLS